MVERPQHACGARKVGFGVALLVAAWVSLLHPAVAETRLERDAGSHAPRLLLSSEEIAGIRQEIAHGCAFKKQALTEMERRLAMVLQRSPRIPTLQGIRRPPNPATRGPGRDGGVREFLHDWGNEAANDARDCAIAFHLTGNEAYLDKARGILLAYVDGLNPLPQDYPDNHQAVHFVSMPMLKFAWVYDLIAAYLSPERRERVEDWLLQAALYLTEHDWTDDRQCVVNWYNACVAAIGYVAQRDELVTWAIERPGGGYLAMLAADIGANGEMVKERLRHEDGELKGIDYGVFNLEAFAILAGMARHNGRDLWGQVGPSGAGLREAALFYAPYVADYVGRRIPEPDPYAGETVAEFKPPVYEILYRQNPDEKLKRVLLRRRGAYDGHLLGDAALLFGVPVE